MDLNFYADLSDGSGNPGDPEFLDPQAFNGFDAVQKVTGAHAYGKPGNVREFSLISSGKFIF